jgi:catechol 2,3-dioxygenase-like lactoylglutathione lyase family enzyme
MIRGVHTMFYSSQADELRAFLRDKLGLPFTDVGAGWLIFDLADAEMGVHPSDAGHAHSRAGMHSISFYCDDIHRTVADLQAKGVEFNNEIADQGYGLVTQFKLPGGVLADLYQPLYKKASAPRAFVSPRPVQEAPVPPSKPRQTKSLRKAQTPLKKTTTSKKPAVKSRVKTVGKKAPKKHVMARKRK